MLDKIPQELILYLLKKCMCFLLTIVPKDSEYVEINSQDILKKELILKYLLEIGRILQKTIMRQFNSFQIWIFRSSSI